MKILFEKVNKFCISYAAAITAFGVLISVAGFIYGFWSHNQIQELDQSSIKLSGDYDVLLQSSTFIQDEINSSTVAIIKNSMVTAPTNPQNSPSNNLAPGAVNNGAMAAGNGAQATVNKLATYTWENPNTWISLAQSTTTFVTMLNFSGSSSILPNQVCAQVRSVGVPIASVVPWSSSGWTGMTTTNGGQQGNVYFSESCFTPTQNQTIQIISSQALQKVSAQLVNQ
jgi:hypothetical protein